jgi:murein DD-endopeptidase MepM/ murein hydrolase activator NlpD
MAGAERRFAAAALALALAGCAGTQDPERAEVDIRGTDPSGAGAEAATAAGAPVPDGAGIVEYDGYVAARAREGDTVRSVAARIGLSAAELGAYNGLSPTHELREGDELVLPPRPEGYEVASADPAQAASAQEPEPEPSVEAQPLEGADEETAESRIGQLPGADGAAAGEAPEGTGWSPDLVASAIDRTDEGEETGTTTPGAGAGIDPPPSATEPLPDNPAEPRDLDSPNLGQYQSPRPSDRPAAGGTARAAGQDAAPEPATSEPEQMASAAPATEGAPRLRRPVEGPIAVPFGTTPDGARNDGVDFTAPPGAPVVAAEDGEVALVSEALGGLGTIVLLRHGDDLLTVYGRIAEVSVSKGEIVQRGQRIGVVAEPPEGRSAQMHFEVRRGARSLDPAEFL